MILKEAIAYVGGFSSPSKMPCYGYSIPAKYCKTGNKLRNVAGSVCSKCYCRKGRYVFPNVQNALERRYATLNKPLWVESMVMAINGMEKSGYFRWHDSGDIQSIQHLENIIDVCKGTPKVIHWLPSKEYSLIGNFLRTGEVFPDNLTVRLSALMLDDNGPVTFAKKYGLVVAAASQDGKFNCMAPLQEGKCVDCRKCWEKTCFQVTYKKH